MEMIITFPGGKKVDASYKGFTINTDQPVHAGGANSAPAPFDLFLASIGTCAGIYVLGFCQQRGLPTAGLTIIQRMIVDERKRTIGKIELEIQAPQDFPEHYHEAMIRTAELCTVKKHLQEPPEFEITIKKI